MQPTLDSVFAELGVRDEAKQQEILALLDRAHVLPDAPPPENKWLAPEDIKTDAATYQFRSGGDRDGVTNQWRLQDTKWNPVIHGDPLLVYERLDGDLFVADGHHRLNLAKRLNADGSGPGLIEALVLKESDGYTPQDIKVIAAYKNLAHGHSDPVDAARVIKESWSPDVHQQWLPQLQLDNSNTRLYVRLSHLSEPALDRVSKERIPVELAAMVADHTRNPERQEAALGLISARLHQDHFNSPMAHFRPGFADRLQRQRQTGGKSLSR